MAFSSVEVERGVSGVPVVVGVEPLKAGYGVGETISGVPMEIPVKVTISNPSNSKVKVPIEIGLSGRDASYAGRSWRSSVYATPGEWDYDITVKLPAPYSPYVGWLWCKREGTVLGAVKAPIMLWDSAFLGGGSIVAVSAPPGVRVESNQGFGVVRGRGFLRLPSAPAVSVIRVNGADVFSFQAARWEYFEIERVRDSTGERWEVSNRDTASSHSARMVGAPVIDYL